MIEKKTRQLIQNFLSKLKSKPVDTYKVKPVASIIDAEDLLNFLWKESSIPFPCHRYVLQLALYINLATITATRPGAIISGGDYYQSLEYGEIELCLERDSNTNGSSLILFVSFHKRKGRRNREELKFPLRDIGDDPSLWPVALVIALAFHDKAFRAPSLTTPAALAYLTVSI